jgi:hypothetical protein
MSPGYTWPLATDDTAPPEPITGPLSDVVRSNKTGAYRVTRRGATTFSKGYAQQAAAFAFNVDAVVAPLAGRELERLPEGERASDRRLFVCLVPLRVSGAEGASDVVAIGGEDFEVEDVEDWSPHGGFYKCIVRKVGR